MATGTTFDYTVTRDRLIELAFQEIGVLEAGQVMNAEMLADGIDALSMVIRETDAAGRWRWTIQAAAHVPLLTNTAVYTRHNGLPSVIAELLTASLHLSEGQDVPVTVLKAEHYESVHDKLRVEVPQAVYLTDHATLADRALYVYPIPGEVPTPSVVTGTDSQPYRCITTHRSSAVTRPITGANWSLYWEAGGTGPSAWVADQPYGAAPSIRLLYRRPLYDFDTASDNPDVPISWPRLIMLKTAAVLSPWYGGTPDEQVLLMKKAQGAFEDVFQQSVAVKSSKRVHRTSYF